MTEDERYEQICRPWLERMEKQAKETEREAKAVTTEILHILKGQNGDPGVVDNVRTIMERRESYGKIGWIVLTVMIGQIIILIFNLMKGQ